jgi:hypothetical protein
MLQTLRSAWPLHLICRTEKGTLIHPERARQSSCKAGVRRKKRKRRRRRRRRRRKRRRSAGYNTSRDDDHSIINCQNIVILGSNIDCME